MWAFFLQSFFPVDKAAGEQGPILDLSPLNKIVCSDNFLRMGGAETPISGWGRCSIYVVMGVGKMRFDLVKTSFYKLCSRW